jgi:DNA-binding transcriptional ArsR family regulator
MIGDDTEKTLSTVYHALRAPRRRGVVRLLAASESEIMTTRTLAKEIAAQERDTSVQLATGEPYRNVYNALSQTHLPTLMEAGIVIYDPERQTVSPGERLPLARLVIAITRPAVKLLADSQDLDSPADGF